MIPFCFLPSFSGFHSGSSMGQGKIYGVFLRVGSIHRTYLCVVSSNFIFSNNLAPGRRFFLNFWNLEWSFKLEQMTQSQFSESYKNCFSLQTHHFKFIVNIHFSFPSFHSVCLIKGLAIVTMFTVMQIL